GGDPRLPPEVRELAAGPAGDPQFGPFLQHYLRLAVAVQVVHRKDTRVRALPDALSRAGVEEGQALLPVAALVGDRGGEHGPSVPGQIVSDVAPARGDADRRLVLVLQRPDDDLPERLRARLAVQADGAQAGDHR